MNIRTLAIIAGSPPGGGQDDLFRIINPTRIICMQRHMVMLFGESTHRGCPMEAGEHSAGRSTKVDRLVITVLH